MGSELTPELLSATGRTGCKATADEPILDPLSGSIISPFGERMHQKEVLITPDRKGLLKDTRLGTPAVISVFPKQA